jgi:hypothetical protein
VIKKVLLIVLILFLGESYSVCRFPSSVDNYGFFINGSRMGTMTNQTLLSGKNYSVSQQGEVKYLFFKDSFLTKVQGVYLDGFQPKNLTFSEVKKNVHTKRQIGLNQYDALSFQLQLRYALLKNSLPNKMSVWMNNKLHILSLKRNASQVVSVPWRSKISTTPVSYKSDDGTTGTLWFAKKYGYLMVDYVIKNPTKKSTIYYTLSSTKSGSRCFLQ